VYAFFDRGAFLFELEHAFFDQGALGGESGFLLLESAGAFFSRFERFGALLVQDARALMFLGQPNQAASGLSQLRANPGDVGLKPIDFGDQLLVLAVHPVPFDTQPRNLFGGFFGLLFEKDSNLLDSRPGIFRNSEGAFEIVDALADGGVVIAQPIVCFFKLFQPLLQARESLARGEHFTLSCAELCLQ
jgi:hypothetical protein